MNNKIAGLLSVAVICFAGCEAGSEHAADEFSSSNFQQNVLESSQVVLVDFWGPG